MAMDLASYVPLPGFKFRLSPTKLVSQLQLKNSSQYHQVNQFIPTVDLFNIDPSEIPGIVNMPWEDKEWYVLSLKREKCGKRKAKSESWNVTGKVKEIMDDEGKKLNAKKSILVRKGIKSEYVIHEIALNDQNASFVICILMKRTVNTVLAEKSNPAKKLKRAKTNHESVAGESSACTESVVQEIDSFSEILQEHNHAQSTGNNVGEASNNITYNSEISQTANSVLSVDDYEIESMQLVSSLEGQKDSMATSNGISNSEVSTGSPVRPEDSFDINDVLFYHELFDNNESGFLNIVGQDECFGSISSCS